MGQPALALGPRLYQQQLPYSASALLIKRRYTARYGVRFFILQRLLPKLLLQVPTFFLVQRVWAKREDPISLVLAAR